MCHSITWNCTSDVPGMCLQLTTVSTTVNIYEWDTGLNSLCYFIFTQSWDQCDSCFSEYQSRVQFAQSHTALSGRLRYKPRQGTVAALKGRLLCANLGCPSSVSPREAGCSGCCTIQGRRYCSLPCREHQKLPPTATEQCTWPGTQEQSTEPSTSLLENTATGNIRSHNPHWLMKPGGGSENSLWPRGDSKVHVFFSALVFLVIYKF